MKEKIASRQTTVAPTMAYGLIIACSSGLSIYLLIFLLAI